MDLLIATQNKGKLREYQQVLADLPVRLLTLGDVSLGEMEVEETGDTFEANAKLKAEAYAKAANHITLADDSGLCVNALDGAPGIYSARYAGKGATNADRRAKLLGELAAVPFEQRTAYFICVTMLVNPTTGAAHMAEGRVYGKIAQQESDGEHGFGYDPVFIADGYDVTLAEIPPDEKNQISHRGRAAQQIRPVIKKIIKES